MSEQDDISSRDKRYNIAICVLVAVTAAITILAAAAVWVDPENAFTIFNTTLPVFASWIGTVLVFYFGKENFESANREVRKIIEATYADKVKKPVTEVMRKIADTRFLDLKEFDEEKGNLDDIMQKYGGSFSRLPVLNPDKSPKYMIHQSIIENYLLNDNTKTKRKHTLSQFIENCKSNQQEFGLDKAFVIVSENATIDEAKRKMEAAGSFCQDIFVTKNGGEKEPLTGWISNVRLTRYLTS